MKRCYVMLLALLALTFVAANASAQSLTGYPDSLSFFKNYFVTGDYVVGGVGLRGTGDASGYATGYISISGVPANAVVVSAFLYWEAIEATSTPSTANGFFQGYPIQGTSIGTGTPPCWSSGGGTGSANGTKHLRVYRADVAPYLVVNGQYQTNTNAAGNPAVAPYQVRLRDSGSNGGKTPLTEGVSLVIVYRVLSAPLRSVVLYDGSWTMNNATNYMSQTIQWFYQASASATARLTHIVGDGQANFGENVYYLDGSGNSQMFQHPFVGSLGGTWDNTTFTVSIPDNASRIATETLPDASASDCLSWGALVFSTPVKDTDGDGLLDTWEDNQGYVDSKDAKTWIALPGANKNVRDLYVQFDFLKNSGATSGPAHSHLPKLDALTQVGNAFSNAGINIHFDVGPNYQGNQYIVPNAVAGTALGGNAIDEDSVSCNDSGTTLCDFPYNTLHVPGIVSWKTGVNYAKNQFFQHGRKDSYHYVLTGHALGLPNDTWDIPDGTLVGITVSPQQVATVTTSTPHGLLPGARVSIGGAVGDYNLGGAYQVQSATTTSFTVNTSGVAPGAYGNFPAQALGYVVTANGVQSNEPGLVVSSGPPLSVSGYSDLGGGDSLVTLGLWTSDDPAGCQANPAIALTAGQVYCSNEVGTSTVQAGTIMHEVGHTLFLTHGGYYAAQNTVGQNCKPNFQSVMNYLFQIRGLPSATTANGAPVVDYSGQVLSPLDESNLVESQGLVTAAGAPVPHYGTRWYGPPTLLDTIAQNTTGGRYAASHCDGTPIGAGEAPAVKITGTTVGAANTPTAIDWNNNGTATNTVLGQDVNFDGFPDSIASDGGLTGFNDWANLYLQQIGARRNLAGFSADVNAADIVGGGTKILGGGTKILGGGSDLINAGAKILGGGAKILGGGAKILGGGTKILGGGAEIDFDTANTTVDPPANLTGTTSETSEEAITSKGSSRRVVTNDDLVRLNWQAPSFGQIRTYYIWRTDITKSPVSAANPPVQIGSVTGAPPATTFTDSTVQDDHTYTYYVTGALGAASGVNAGNQSGPSNTFTVTIP